MSSQRAAFCLEMWHKGHTVQLEPLGQLFWLYPASPLQWQQGREVWQHFPAITEASGNL